MCRLQPKKRKSVEDGIVRVSVVSAVTCWNVSELEQAAASQTVYLLLLIEYPAGEAGPGSPGRG